MATTKKITVRIPATSANLGPGFDVLGVALHLYNDIHMEAEMDASRHTKGVKFLSIDVVGEGVDLLPRDESNLVLRAAYRVFEKAGVWPRTLQIKLVNHIPLSRGLGSSAAATLGGMCAANRLLPHPLADDVILNLAVAMEGHPDNVVPSFMGGFCISGYVDNATHYLKFPAPAALHAVICIPDRPLSTAKARNVLPSRIPLRAAVFNTSRTAFFIGALLQKRYEMFSFAMDDVLHQPARAALLPGLRQVIEAAKAAGAYGAALSGAGSSVIALTVARPVTKAIGHAMQKAFAAHGISSRSVDLALENKGIHYS